ncbi:membrane protein [Nocardioides baekrokdamisoli]|uniref:Membrane protein n=1 Tax=Nocardioides baekrokdamisoli TaxID=1804624 RepID=A0A3G9J189_9ACTN|nr:protein kinase family protein [Nocardioides baekrokdamisoli]BBH17398.1 membrane protein [Nocardioides baekrokdamisoli]
MTVHHAGDVLGRRYQLAELLVDAGAGAAWLAHDKVLGRSISIHEVPETDVRAEKMRNAARAAALANDPRLLRVLDFDVEAGTLYVVSEWGAGLTLNHAVAHGPLDHERAARMAEHISRAISHAHSAGVTHGRLAPENVLVDEAGEVRIIGTAIEAALLGLPRSTVAQDTADVVGLLYAALTGKWAGRSESSLPTAPRGPDGRFLRVRQVRAGVPPVLDEAVARVAKPGGSLSDLQATLATWLGVHVEAHAGDVTTDTALDLTPIRDTGRHAAPPAATAPEPRIVRRDDPMPSAIAPAPDAPSSLPGSRWMQIALAAAMVLFLVVGVFFAFQLGHDKSGSGAAGPGPQMSFGATDFDPLGNLQENPDQVKYAVDGYPSTSWTTMTYLQQLGPKGDKLGVGLVLDLHQSSNVTSVELTLVGDGSAGSIYVLPDQPALAASTVGTGNPITMAGVAPAASGPWGTHPTITLPAGTKGRYVVVWFTALPKVGGSYRGAIAEVDVTGTPAP